MMVSGPNLNETSIVSGGYGGTAEGIIPTSTIKGRRRPGPVWAGGDGAGRGVGCVAGIGGEGCGGGAEQSALPAHPACCWGQASRPVLPRGAAPSGGSCASQEARGHRQKLF